MIYRALIFSRSRTRGVLAQFEIHLSVAGVDGDHARRTVLQQTVGESTGRGPDIEADFSLDIDLPIFKSALKFKSSTADVLQVFAE